MNQFEETTTNTKKPKSPIVLGICSLIAWLLPIAGLPVSIIGIYLGIKHKNKVSKAGLVCSIIGLILTILNAVAGVILSAQLM